MPNLIWKEWREQRWKLGFGCVVLAATAYIGLHARMIADEAMLKWVCALGFLLPVLSATGLVPAERAEGTLESLLALPVTPWRILLSKTLMGLLLCAGPMAAAAAVSVMLAGGREMTSDDMIVFYVRATLATLALFIWTTALTIHLPNETRAGLLGLGVLMFWVMATAALAFPPIPWPALAISPLSFVFKSDQPQYQPPLIGMAMIQAVVTAALWIWASTRLATGAEEKS